MTCGRRRGDTSPHSSVLFRLIKSRLTEAENLPTHKPMLCKKKRFCLRPQPIKGESAVDEAIERFLLNLAYGTAIIDRELRFVTVNEALATINGISVSAHIGRPIRDIVGDAANVLEPTLRRVFTEGAPARTYITAKLPNRSSEGCWIVDYVPIRETAGEINNIAAIVSEITREKNIEMCLAVLTRRLPSTLDRMHSWVGSMRRLNNSVRQILDADVQRGPEPRGPIGLRQTDRLLLVGGTESQEQSDQDELAPRIRETIRLLASGSTVKEAAARMGISVKTVGTYRERGMRKLNLHSNADIVRYAIRKKLISL
jgi:PAS domain S-box-containing protein